MYFLLNVGRAGGTSDVPIISTFSAGLCKKPALKQQLKFWSQHNANVEITSI